MEENNNIENSPQNKSENNQISPAKNQTQIAGAIVLAGLMIAGAILLKGNGTMVVPTGTTTALISQKAMDPRPVSPDEHILGSADAKIVIVEYSDTECPFCKSFHGTLHNTVTKNNGNVAWVFRHYPIAGLHPKAFHEAEATECAWEQGGNDAFWKYTDEIFTRTQSNNKLDVAELPKIASAIGLNLASFNTCLASGKYASKIEADLADGRKAGGGATPYSVILTKKDISTKTQNEIALAINKPDRPPAVSFSSTKKNAMSMNGSLPPEMVDLIISTLLK